MNRRESSSNWIQLDTLSKNVQIHKNLAFIYSIYHMCFEYLRFIMLYLLVDYKETINPIYVRICVSKNNFKYSYGY